jgi:hypothetical protein
VHRHTGIRPRAIVWGLVVAACLIGVMAGSGVAAQEPNPEPLWNAYPLDEQGSSGSAGQNASTTTTQPAASPAAATTEAPVTVTDEAGDGPPWLLMIAAAAGGALFVVALLMLQSRRAHGGRLAGPADEWPWLTSKATGEARDVPAERLRNAPRAPMANGAGGDRGADVARSGSERERAAELWREAERERAAEPVSNGAVAEPSGEPEQERAVEPANGAVAEPSLKPEQERAVEPATGTVAEPAADAERAGEHERVVEREPSAEPERERAAEPVSNGVVAEPERAAEAEPVAEREPATNGVVAEPTSPAFEVIEADAVPRNRFDREPETSNGRPGPARRGPVCQVRWSAPGTCFYAATTDVNGVEHRLAWSPQIEWREPGPPDEDSREARAAVRVLAKELRDKGWRPMRAKGDDFDEQRWYARRFRFPVAEGDDDVAPWQHGPPTGASRAHGEP